MAEGKEKVLGSMLYRIHADTRSLSRKLRAVSKHFEALADELDQIDRETEAEAEAK